MRMSAREREEGREEKEEKGERRGREKASFLISEHDSTSPEGKGKGLSFMTSALERGRTGSPKSRQSKGGCIKFIV